MRFEVLRMAFMADHTRGAAAVLKSADDMMAFVQRPPNPLIDGDARGSA